MKTFTKDLLSKQPWGHSEPAAGKPRQCWEGGGGASVKGTGSVSVASCLLRRGRALGSGSRGTPAGHDPAANPAALDSKQERQHAAGQGRGSAAAPCAHSSGVCVVREVSPDREGSLALSQSYSCYCYCFFIQSNNVRVLSFMKRCSSSLCILSSI